MALGKTYTKGTTMKKTHISASDAEELTAYMLGITEELGKYDDPYSYIDEVLSAKFGIGIYTFHTLVEHLLPLITVGKSPLTGVTYKGFADNKSGQWLLKQKMEQK